MPLENGYGLKARWFQSSQTADLFERVATADVTALHIGNPLGLGITRLKSTLEPSEALSAHARLNLLSWDIEGTKEFIGDNGWIAFSFGGRYVHLSSDYYGYIGSKQTPLPTTKIVRTYVESGHNFNGGGPTGAFDFARNLGTTGFGIYGSARAAIICGNTHQTAQSRIVSQTSGVESTATSNATRDAFSTIPQGEFEIGGQYRRAVGRATLFTQFGFAANIWGNVGNATTSEPNFTQTFSHTLTMLGFVARVGFEF